MGRRQKPLGGSTEAERFALRLRELRAGRGLTIRRLADRAGYAPSTLSKAESGEQVPSWEVTEAFVQACGADPAAWRRAWLTADTATAQPPPPGDPSPADASLGEPQTGDPSAGAPVPSAGTAGGRGLRAFVLVGVLLVVVVLAGAVLWLLKPGRQGDPAVPDASAGTGEWRELAEVLPSPGRPGDGMDPIRAECGSPAVVATVITLDEVSVRLPGGAEFGRLRLRHQPSCRASWGQVLGPHGQDRVVHIVLRRPADRVSAPSSFGGQSPTSHGNLLLTTSGCVYAEAFVRTPEGDGPVVRTRCA